MSKLIAQYRRVPTGANRNRLQAYLSKHQMAVCMASPEELAFLQVQGFSI